jgi:hypothetical protein
MLATSAQVSLRKVRGPIDGRRFFSTPLFRSYNFMALTAIALTGVVYDFYLAISAISHFHSIAENWMVVFLFIATGFAYSWLAVVLNFRRIQAISPDQRSENIEEGSPIDIALGVAAWCPQQALMYCYGSMILMEVFIGRLLSKAGT